MIAMASRRDWPPLYYARVARAKAALGALDTERAVE